MYNKGLIVPLILVLVCIVAFPFIKAAGTAAAEPALSLNTPEINAMSDKKCIEDTEFMRENHMKLLNQWRVDVVRKGDSVYTAADGTQYNKSIEETCLSCHSNKEEFCDQCHNYSNVSPDCWKCHVGGEQ